MASINEEMTVRLWIRTLQEQRIAELAAKIDAAEAEVAQLTLDIKDANALLAKIDAYVAEATTIRKVGKSENAEAVKDAQDAQTALAHAIAVLTDFYKQSGMIEKELLQDIVTIGVFNAHQHGAENFAALAARTCMRACRGVAWRCVAWRGLRVRERARV
eukprot:2572260-Amphidinium_carterae.1